MSKEEVINDLSEEEVVNTPTVDTPVVVDSKVEEEEKQEEKEDKKDKEEEGAKLEDKKSKEDKVEEKKGEEKEDDNQKPIEQEKKEKESDVPPPKPSRPLTPRQEALKNLKDAFPSVEEKLITTVLIASSYQLEPAFNSLLYYSDPESVNVDDLVISQAVTQPPLPQRPSKSQLEQDELLAKQLDEEFNRKERRRAERRQRQHSNTGQSYLEEDENVFTNFVEKDLPQLKEQFNKNVEETKTKFNSWVSGWKKNYQESQTKFQQSREQQQQQQHHRQNQYNFDDDPEELDLQKIHGISLNDNSAKTTGDDLYNSSGNNKKKWEPLASTKPEPISKDGDHGVVDDDFLLSDDEAETSNKK